MKYLSFFSAIIILSLVSCKAVSPQPVLPVLEQDAVNALSNAEKLAHTNVEKLCEFSGSTNNCKESFDDRNGETGIPSAPPKIVASYPIKEQTASDGHIFSGGWILVLEGVDGLGKPYQTDFLVLRTENNEIRPLNAIYWSGIKIQATNNNNENTTIVSP